MKLSILKDLKFLGEKGGHLWEGAHITKLISAVLPSEDKMDTDEEETVLSEIVFHALNVISSITSSSAIFQCIYVAGTVDL